MRVEVMGLMGQRIAVLATDGDHYDLYRAETGGVERGTIHPAILWEVAGVPLTRPARELRLDSAGRPRHYQVGAGDDALLTAEWDEYKEVGASAFAHRVELDFPRAGARAEVSFRRVEINPPLPDALFRLDVSERVSSPAEGDP
jgi:hypothetical protein